jgi:hypothetical protein
MVSISRGVTLCKVLTKAIYELNIELQACQLEIRQHRLGV